MQMHVNQLIYFSKVVETGTIRVAAQKLHISQPALSKSIKELEAELGQTLISRTNRGIQPTAAGWKVYKEFQTIKPVLEGWYAAEKKEKISIHISCIHSATSMFLNQIVIPFKKIHSEYEIVMQNQYVTEIFDTLKNSPVNIAVTSLPQLKEKRFLEEASKKNLKVHLLFKGTRCLLVGAAHPIARKESLTQEDLKGLSMVTYSTSGDRPAIIYAPFFRETYKLANKESIMELVIENEAVWLPIKELVANDFYVKNHLVKMYPIPISEFAHKVSVVAITTAALSEHEEQFVCYLLDHFSAK